MLKEAVDQMSTSAQAATLRLEATTEQIARELEKVKEKMHYSIRKRRTAMTTMRASRSRC